MQETPRRQRRHRADRPSNYCTGRCTHATTWVYFRDCAKACDRCGVRTLHTSHDPPVHPPDYPLPCYDDCALCSAPPLCPSCFSDDIDVSLHGTREEIIAELRATTAGVIARDRHRRGGGP